MEISTWRKFPQVLLGFVQGPVRYEGPSGDYYAGENKILINADPVGQSQVTHIQYKSWFGFLLYWPLCFHGWIQLRKQKVAEDGNKIPGSELVLYFRIGIARWQASTGTYMVPTLYPPFGHWD